MKINELKDKDLRTIYPNKSKVSLKEMAKEEINEYMKIYNLYRKLYTEYMIELLDLKKIDKLIRESELKFCETLEDDMDIYQYFSSQELKYFYIRNNVYIERLNDSEKALLKDMLKNKNYDLNKDAKCLIENTYKKVIFEGTQNYEKKCITSFGPPSRSFLASSDSIVIGFRYNEFYDKGLSDNEWRENHIKQLDFIEKMFQSIIEKNNKNAKIPIHIIKYTEFSIRRRLGIYMKN